MNFKKIKEKFSKRREKDDTGSGLVSLIGVSMIVVITASAITSSATFSTNKVSSSLSQQQAKDYAKVGLDVAELRIEDASINANANYPSSFSGSNGDSGEYTVNISHSDAAYIQRPDSALSRVSSTDEDKDKYSQWRTLNKIQDGWPTAADKWIIVESIGKGLHNQLSSTIAIYEWRDADVAVSPYALAGNNVSLTNSTIDKSSGVTSNASVLSTNGYFRCMSGGISVIKGDLKKDKPGSTSYIDNCTVEGNIYSKYFIRATSTNAAVKGTFFTTLSATSQAVKEGIKLQSGMTTLANWTPTLYGYSPNLTVTDGSDFKPKVTPLTVAQCGNKTTLPQLIKSQTKPIILDATSCTSLYGLYSPAGSKVELNSDVAIIMDRAPSLKDFNISSADGNHHSLTIAVRSNSESTDSISNSVAGGNFAVNNVNTDPGVSMMLYSRDQLTIQNSEITGQAMAGTTLNFAKSKLHYHPVKLLGTTKVVSPKNGAPGLVRVY